MNHLDTDTLVDLGGALDWREDILAHLWECPECRNQIHELGAMYRDLEHEDPVRAGFVDAVVTSLPREPVPASAGVAWVAIKALFGAGIGVVVLGLAAAQGAPLQVDPVILGAAALAGALGAWRLPSSMVTG